MSFKDLVDVTAAVLSTAVLVVGAIFAYLKFIKEKPLESRANISQVILSKKLNDKFTLIHVQLTIANAGTAELSVHSGYTCAQQIYPLHEKIAGNLNAYFVAPSGSLQAKAPEEWLQEWRANGLGQKVYDDNWLRLNWPIIAERYHVYDKFVISAGETEHFDCDLLIPANVNMIVVYSSFDFSDERDAPLWERTTYHDIERDSSGNI